MTDDEVFAAAERKRALERAARQHRHEKLRAMFEHSASMVAVLEQPVQPDDDLICQQHHLERAARLAIILRELDR